MSEDRESQGPGKRRRRRRRKRPRDQTSGGTDTGTRESGAAETRGPTGDHRRGPSTADGEGQRRRRRRRRPGGERSGPPRGERSAPPRGARSRPRPAADAPAASEPPPASEAADSDIDAGWELDPAPAPAPPPVDQETSADIGDADDYDVDTAEPWGQDEDLPTAEVALAPDMPANPAHDDPDPVGAALDDEEEVDEDDTSASLGRMVANVVGVKFAPTGKIYLYDGGDAVYRRGDEVIVEGDRGTRTGMVAIASERCPSPRGKLSRVVRRAGRTDRRKSERRMERSAEVLSRARARAKEIKAPIKVYRADFSMAGNRTLLYFSSEGKIDTRSLARSLGQGLPGRVELRQTGVRDEAKFVGGIGSCGQPLCCTTWLPAFAPVSIKNAKDQGLVLNPTTVSGQCGRLKCCLVYEQETYADLRKHLPKLGKRVITSDGEGRVVEVDVLKQKMRVSLVSGETKVFRAGEVEPMFPSKPPQPRPPGDKPRPDPDEP